MTRGYKVRIYKMVSFYFRLKINRKRKEILDKTFIIRTLESERTVTRILYDSSHSFDCVNQDTLLDGMEVAMVWNPWVCCSVVHDVFDE